MSKNSKKAAVNVIIPVIIPVVKSISEKCREFFSGLSVITQLISSINYYRLIECRLTEMIRVVKEKRQQLEHQLEIEQGKLEVEKANEKVKDFQELNASAGVEFTFNEAFKILFPVTRERKTAIRQSVIDENENSINYPQLWETMFSFKCSFKQLPFEVRSLFNGNTRSKYTSYFPYCNSLLTEGKTGNGYISEVIRTKGVKWFEGKKPSDFPYIPNYEKVSDGTINQFLKIYKSYQEYGNVGND